MNEKPRPDVGERDPIREATGIPREPVRRRLVELLEARCRTCDSQLLIEKVDDTSLHVACTECRDGYEIEPDVLGK